MAMRPRKSLYLDSCPSFYGTTGFLLLFGGISIIYYSISTLRSELALSLVKTKDCASLSHFPDGNTDGNDFSAGLFNVISSAKSTFFSSSSEDQKSNGQKDSSSSFTFWSTEGKPEPIRRNLDAHSAKFFLYRMIGNNMPPLQCFGQLLINTRYALKYEPEFPGCRKLWVLNNIVNETEQALVLDALIGAGYTMKDIIVRRINWAEVAEHPEESWTKVVTAQNKARNMMLEHGVREGARWILAFDGNQYYTTESWNELVAAANRWEAQGKKYFKVPMYRMYSDQSPSWLNAATRFELVKKYAPVLWESQIAFRNDSDARYVEGMLYGKDNKLELIDRVCGTGDFHPKKGKEMAGIVDTGNCGCHEEAGNERHQREVIDSVAHACGYSVRLWYYPCEGVNASRIFVDRWYRAGLREDGHKYLTNHIVQKVKEWRKENGGSR